MRAINLLDDDARRQDGSEGLLTPITVGIGAGSLFLVVFVAIGFLFLTSRSTVSDKRETLEAVQQQVAAAEAAMAASLAPGAEQAQLTAFRTAASARLPWDTLLGDLAKVMPAGSWLSSLTLHMPAPPPPVTVATSDTSTTVTANGLASSPVTPTAPVVDVTTFQISGFALSNDVVAKVMQQLELVPMISNVSLKGTQRTAFGERNAFSFSMSASLSFVPANGGADQQ
jgi:Tfp pilus assembly protein PilN